MLGRRIYIKTFNDHLKKLCEKSTVLRKEKNRYHVTYELENIDDYVRNNRKIVEELRKKLAAYEEDAEAFRDIVEVLRDPEKRRKFKRLLTE